MVYFRFSDILHNNKLVRIKLQNGVTIYENPNPKTHSYVIAL